MANGNSSFYTPFNGILYAFDGYSSCFVYSQPTLNPGGTGCSGTSILGINPSQGTVGQTLTGVMISGCGFSTTKTNDTIQIGQSGQGISANVTQVSADGKTLTASITISPSTPAGSYSVTVKVTKPDGSTVATTDPVNFAAASFQGVLTPSDNFAGRSTTRFGIGEVINLSSIVGPSGVTAASLGGLQWTIVSGR